MGSQTEESTKYKRTESNRAHSKKPEKGPDINTFSSHRDRVYPGKTIAAFSFPLSGRIYDFEVFIETLTIKKMPVMIYHYQNNGKKEMPVDLNIGDNELDNIEIAKGDKIIIKGRDMKDRDFNATNVFVSFNLVTNKIVP